MPAAASPSSFHLADLGWDDAWSATLDSAAAVLGRGEGGPARVARVDVGAATLLSARGEGRATVPPGVTVAVGDWVVAAAGVVAGALPRRTAIVRRAAGAGDRPQTLAANVDTVLVLVAADGRVTPRSVERYVTLVWESGAVPVVVLTKTDLVAAQDVDAAVERLEPACVGVALHGVSAATGAGLGSLAPCVGRGSTVALLGSSGAGKSTLANRLTGAGLATGPVRGDGRGRHTTTHRELVALPGGGVLIDTPGLREVGLWAAGAGDGVERTFPEINALLGRCRFTDCSHRSEPGCALRAAVDDGRVGPERLASWHKLRRELDRLAARDDPARAAQLRTEQRRVFREYAQTRKQWDRTRKGR